jgi:heme a synthase
MGGMLSRWRTFTVSPKRLQRLAVISVAALLGVMVTGALVRLTASGLGCDNWPRCGDTPFPEREFHALIEFGNRVIALIAIAITIAVAVAARRVAGLPRRTSLCALGTAIGTVGQIPLGGLTVILDLNPYAVMSHFFLALLMLGLAVLVALDARAFTGHAPAPRLPRPIGLLSLLLLPAAVTLIVTGALVTAAGPHPGASGEEIPRLGNVVDAAHVHAVATAVFGSVFAVCLLVLLLRRGQARYELGLGIGVLALLGVEIGVGQWQWNTGLPWGVVLLHVALASAVWAGLVALVARIVQGAGVLSPAQAHTRTRGEPAPLPSP